MYALDASNGMRIFDVTVPTSPVEVCFVGTTWARRLELAGDVAHVLSPEGELEVVDISDPTRPSRLGLVSLNAASGNDLATSDGFVYVADSARRLTVVDATDPSAPREVATSYLPGRSFAVALSGHHLFVAAGPGGGLRVVDVADPLVPVEVGSLDTAGTSGGIAVAGNVVYLADGAAGLLAIGVETPSSPVPLAVADVPDSQLTVAGGVVLAVGADHALRALHRCRLPHVVAPITASPRRASGHVSPSG